MTFTDRLVFLDTETVTLDPAKGSVWEVAVMRHGDDEPTVTQVRPDLSIAHPKALEVGGFGKRYRSDKALDLPHVRIWMADNIPQGSVLVGSNPWFDMGHLSMQVSAVDRPNLPWHYHPLDLPSMVAGATGKWPDADESLSLSWAAETVGLDPDDYETHTAAGDVLLAGDIWMLVRPGGILADNRCSGHGGTA